MHLTNTARLLVTAAALAGLSQAAFADGVDDYLKAQMTARHIPGLSVVVVQNGKVVKAQGYGLANVEQSSPATADTIYPIGSLSKQFTAVAVMLLVQEGKVKLDAPLSQYLAAMPKTWQPITVRELLNQTSGIPEWEPNLDKDSLLHEFPLAEIANKAALKPLLFTPGTQFAYSNTNYNLLAGIIEKASGKPYSDFLRARLFMPLNMASTGVYDPQEIVLGRSAGCDRFKGKVYNNTFLYDPSYYLGAGNLESTVSDMGKWDAALVAGKVLPAPALTQIWTPPTLPGGNHTSYGMGWDREIIKGHLLLWHNGSITGCMGFVGRFPGDHLSIVILSNMMPLDGFDDTPPFFGLGLGLAKHYLPDFAKHDDGIPDTDPQTAALLKTVSAQLASGTLDKSLFAPSFQVLLTPAAVDPAHALLAPLGPLTSLALLRRDAGGPARYRALYGTTAVDWLIAVDKDHKITGLRPQPE